MSRLSQFYCSQSRLPELTLTIEEQPKLIIVDIITDSMWLFPSEDKQVV
jgi:hypothetical protein